MKNIYGYLEELFNAELPGYDSKYPPQLKKPIAKKLIEYRLIEEIKIVDGSLHLTCHQLSHLGRMMYGQWASSHLEYQEIDSPL
jgi:hypothetical protein